MSIHPNGGRLTSPALARTTRRAASSRRRWTVSGSGPLKRGELTVARFFREARRRKVFRTAALYIVGAWLSLQVADVLFPEFGIPSAAIQALVWAAVAGFPVALVFGWLSEVGPGGVHRTVAASSDAIAPQLLGRRRGGRNGCFAGRIGPGSRTSPGPGRL